MAKSVDLPDIRAIERDSTDIFQVLQTLASAEAALRARDYLSAKKGYESVLLHDPDLGTARAGLRRTLIATGQAEEAARYIDDATSADAVLIRVLMGRSDHPTVELKTALETHQDARLWNALGHLQDDQGHFAAARQAYARANLLGQRAGLAENNTGQSHWVAGEFEQALTSFEQAVQADPRDTRFDNNRRRALVKLGRVEFAIVGLTSEEASVFLGQAGVQAEMEGEIRLAKLLYQKSLDLAPRHNPTIAERLEALEQ
ncbi:tetratricopeptide repeat protein [Litorimonas sp. WD9-15]|uniref:tetratricopeptide repeat protein n=1 Tax=Litorimonas sp. WD9-15 TaxID=3418716 RepID=UPI003D028B43